MNPMLSVYNKSYPQTLLQHDTLTFFIKNGKGKDSFMVSHLESTATQLGKYAPVVGSFAGLLRIVEAVKVIFNELSKKEGADKPVLWEAFRNLFRGLAEFCPLSGLFLIIYDAAKNSLVIKAQLAKELQNQDHVVGVAIQGIVFTSIDIDDFKKSGNFTVTSNSEILAFYSNMALDVFKNNAEKQLENINAKDNPRKITETLTNLTEQLHKLSQKNN
jgi:hypothetical protein